MTEAAGENERSSIRFEIDAGAIRRVLPAGRGDAVGEERDAVASDPPAYEVRCGALADGERPERMPIDEPRIQPLQGIGEPPAAPRAGSLAPVDPAATL